VSNHVYSDGNAHFRVFLPVRASFYDVQSSKLHENWGDGSTELFIWGTNKFWKQTYFNI